MGRIRTIKPEFPQSESVGRISREGRLCFILLWTTVDDSGRTRASSRLLASLLYPYDEDAPQLMDTWLNELEKERFIDRYVIDGNAYLQICKWNTHQKIDHPSLSRLPSPRESSRILAHDLVPSTLDLVPVPSTEDHNDANAPLNKKSKDSEVLHIYEAYPHKIGKAAALKAIEKAFIILRKRSEPNPERFLLDSIHGWIQKRERDSKIPGEFVPHYPHPATWFNQGRYDDEGNFPKPKKEVRVMTQREIDEDNYRHLGTPPPEEWAPEGAPQGWVPECRN